MSGKMLSNSEPTSSVYTCKLRKTKHSKIFQNMLYTSNTATNVSLGQFQETSKKVLVFFLPFFF